MVKAQRRALDRKFGRAGAVGHFPIGIEQVKHALHVRQALLDFAIQNTQEIERDV